MSHNFQPRATRQPEQMLSPIVIDGKLYKPTMFPDGKLRNVLVQPSSAIQTSGERLRAAIQPQALLDFNQAAEFIPEDEVAQLKRAQRALQEMGGTIEQKIAAAESARELRERAVDQNALRRLLNESGQTPLNIPDYPVAQPVIHQPYTTGAQEYPVGGLSTLEIDDTSEPSKKMSRTRKIGISVIAGVVLVGGGTAVAATNLPGGFMSKSITPDQVPAAVDPDTIPALSAATLVDSFGSCLDERGAGKALYRGLASSETTSSWSYKNGDKTFVLEFLDNKTMTNIKPLVKLIEMPVDYTACVEEKDRADVLKIDGETVTVDLAKISPQVYIGPNKGYRGIREDLLFKDVLDLAVANKAMTAEESARLLKDYDDPANAAAELAQAQVQAVGILAQEDGIYAKQANETTKKEIEARINDTVATLNTQGLSVAKSVTVNFTGELDDPKAKDPMAIKNPAAAKSDKFVLDKNTTVLPFTIKNAAPGVTNK